MSRYLLASCLCASSLLLGAKAQVTTADVYFPIAGDSKSLMAEFQASVVSSEGQTTVYALSCTDGPCNPVAGGTGTLTFTEAPDTFIYTATFAGGMDYDLQCTRKGCPSVTDVKCVTSRVKDGETTVDISHPTFTARMPLSLDHEVPEATPAECSETSAPAKTKAAGDEDDGGEGSDEDSSDGNEDGESEESEEGKDGKDGKDGEGAGFVNGPVIGLVAAAAVGAAAVLL